MMSDLLTDPQLPLGVVPVLIGPLQVLLALLPAMLAALFGAIVAMLKPSSIKAFLKILWHNKIGTLVTVAAIVGICYAFSYVRSLFGTKASKVETAKSDWPMFRGGVSRRGAVLDDAGDPTTPCKNWDFTEVKKFYSSPAVLGNRVFATSANIGPMRDRGSIYCLDADTGAKVWEYAPRGFRATYSSPSVHADYLVCGEGLHYTRDARIVCLKLENDRYKLLWEFRTKSHVESSACIYDGKTYIGAGDDGLYCIALEPSNGVANVVWHVDGKKYPDCETSPLAHDGRVYFGLGMGGKALVCLDANTGAEIWKQHAPYPVFSHPTYAAGRIFVGMGNGNVAETGDQVRIKEIQKLKNKGASGDELKQAEKEFAPGGEIWCLNAQDGAILWSNKLTATVVGTIAEADGKLYLGDQSGTITCLNLDGKLHESRNVRQPMVTSPAVGRKYVYFTASNGRLYCLDKETLAPVWEMNVGTGSQNWSSPCVARGHVYVGTEANGVVCLGAPSEGRKIEVWAGSLGGPGKSGWADGSPLPARAAFAWRYPPEDTNAPAIRIAAPPAFAGRALYLPIEGRTGVVRLSLGEKRGAKPEEAWFYPTSNAVSGCIAVRDTEIMFVEGKPGEQNRVIHFVAATNGATLRKRAVTDDASGSMTASEHGLFVFDTADGISFIPGEESRRPAWFTNTGRPVGAPAVSGDLVAVSAASPPSVSVLSVIGGNLLWSTPLDSEPSTGPVICGTSLAVGTSNGLTALSLVDGSVVWTASCAGVAGRLVCDKSRVLCAAGPGAIAVFDWAGNKTAQIDDSLPGITPLLCGDSMLYFSTSGVKSLELASNTQKSLMGNIAWLGAVVTPAILADSHLYFATAGKGLVCVKPK